MWQLLGADRARRGHHGAAAAVHYSTAAAAAAAPDSSRSFCLSRGKLSLQQLNRRLAAYLQQVRSLEAANQRLERQIQEELDRKCPRERRQLDRYLKASSLLQKQISDGQSTRAQMKLQLLSAELTVLDLSLRCEKERERRGGLEAELGDLRMLEEVLQEHTLPELGAVLSDQQQQLLQLQTQHNQDQQRLRAQLTAAGSLEVQAEASDLIQQLDDLRWTGAALLHNHNDTQVSMRGQQVTFGPAAGSEVIQAELQELRRTAASLEEELTHLQAQSLAVEASGLQRAQSFVQQLAALQRRADGLCVGLDAALQAAAQQAEDHKDLLDVKGRLETEILDYRRLLDGLNQHGVPSFPLNSALNVPSSPSALRRNSSVNTKLNVQRGSLRMMVVQTVSRGHKQAPVVPVSSTKPPVQTIKPPKSSPVRSINTSKPENQRTGLLSGRTGRETKTVQQSVPVLDKVPDRDPPFVSTQVTHISDKRGEVKASRSEIKAAQTLTTLVPDAQSAGSPELQAEPETFKQATTTEKTIQEITKADLSAETPEPSTETAAEVKTELETSSERPAETSSGNMNSTEGSNQDMNQEVVSVSSEIHAEAAGQAGKYVVTASFVSESLIPKSEEAAADESTPEIQTEQAINMLVPDAQTAISAAQVKPEEDSLAKEAETHTETEISKIIIHAEPEVKEGSHFEMNMTTPEPSRETAAEIKTELETSPEGPAETSSGHMNSTEGSNQGKNQEVVSLEIHAEAVGHAGDVTASFVSGSHVPKAEEAAEENKETGTAICTEDPVQTQPSVLDTQAESVQDSGEVSATEPAETQSLRPEEAQISAEPTLIQDKGPNTEDRERTETERTETSEVNGFHDAETKAEPTEMDKKSVSLTDSGVSSSDHEETLSPSKDQVFMSPAEPFSCLEAAVLLSVTDEEFRPVDEEERTSPDSLFSPEPEMFLSPNDLDSCLSPSGEEEEACLSLTEAISLVRPVEKYVLSTKEEVQTLSFGTDQSLPGRDEDGQRKVSVSVEDGDGLSFGSFEGDEVSRDALNVTTIRKPTSPGFGFQPGGGAGSESGGRVGQSIIADKEKQVGFGGLYRQIGRDSTSPGVRYDFKNQEENVDASRGTSSQSDLVTSFGGTAGHSSGAVSGTEAAGRFRRGSGDWMVYGGPGHVSTTVTSRGSQESPSAAGRAETGRFGSRGSGEWAVYGGSLGRKSSSTRTGSEESPSVSRRPAMSPSDGRLAAGQVVYSSNVKRSDASPFTSRENQPAPTNPAASPPATGRFGSGGSGEWRFYGGTSGRVSGVAGGEGPPGADSGESQPLATSPPGTGRFGSRGSGEWRVYGGSRDGSTERVSAAKTRVISPPSSYTGGGPRLSGSVVRRSSSVGSGGRLSSSGSGGSGRFSSTGSGDGKPVYSAASGRRSSAGSAGRPAGGASSHRAPSPGGRVSAGSGGWLSALTAGAGRISGGGSGSKVSGGGSGDRISGNASRRISGSSGSGRSSSTGGRVISSSDRPIRSTGSGAGGNKERISVCKMAALSISAAGREKSQDRRRQQQHAAASSPLVQRWLTTAVGVTSADPDGLDDVMRL